MKLAPFGNDACAMHDRSTKEANTVKQHLQLQVHFHNGCTHTLGWDAAGGVKVEEQPIDFHARTAVEV
jgi:hypothetical protein